uniref:WAP domain-containing protein n=1 Tax=Sinocyclocheilus anshuiensis TaxID=1608454 RepID=A0A671L0F5_9TELE
APMSARCLDHGFCYLFCISAKPGVCPIYNLDGAVFIACLELCSRDGNCPNDEKCCSNGCGHQCMPPYKVKPGVCPRRFLGVGLCKGLCVNDIDCPKDEKCCSTKCGRKCTHPYKGIRYIGAWVPNTHRF